MSEALPDAVLALCRAACGGEPKAAARLLRDDPELPARSIHAAAVTASIEALEAHLASDAALASAPLGRGATPLLLACHSQVDRHGQRDDDFLACARALLDAGAAVDASLATHESPSGRTTPLAGAAGARGCPRLCRLLLDVGAQPNDGAALFAAAAADEWTAAAELLAAGGDWNARDPTGAWAPLHWILDLYHDPARVERLLAGGADPNLRVGEREETALHVAVVRRRAEILPTLVKAGADVDARTRGGMTAYRHALRRRFPDVVDALRELGCDTTTTPADDVAVALWEQRHDEARGLLEADPALLHEAPIDEQRLFPDLAAAGEVEALRVLLEAGIDLTWRGLDDGTALHQAAWFGQPEAAELLLEHGAPLDLHDREHGCTPLGWVTHGSRFSGSAAERGAAYVRLAQAILEAGADVSDPADHHDDASDAVKDVLRQHGWKG